MMSNIFQWADEHSCIIVCVFLLGFALVFLAALIVDGKQRKELENRIDNLNKLAKIQDNAIVHLSEQLLHAKAETFAARADKKRECGKLKAKLEWAEYKLNQYTKADN